MDWLDAIHAQHILGMPDHGLLHDVYQAIQMGLIPICWKGTHPDGYLVVYAPPGSAAAEAALRHPPTKAQLAAGKPKPAVKIPVIPTPDVPQAPTDLWERLVSAADQRAALGSLLLSAWVETPDDAQILDRLLASVARVEVAIPARADWLSEKPTRHLIAHFLGAAGPVRWLFATPYRKELAGLPASLARIVRVANGNVITGAIPEAEDAEAWLRQHAYRGKGRFVDTEWDEVWYDAAGAERSDPFKKTPLLPLSDSSSNIYVGHPLTRRAPDEPTLHYMTHDFGRMTTALPWGVGGIQLRHALNLLDPTHTELFDAIAAAQAQDTAD